MSERKRKLDEIVNEEVKVPKMEFKCDICHSTFSTKSNLTRHVLSHTAYFKCSKCFRQFRRKDNLKTHLKRQHMQSGGGLDHVDNLPAETSNSSSDRALSSTQGRKPHQLMDHAYASTQDSNLQRNEIQRQNQDHLPRPNQFSNMDHNYTRNTFTQTSLNRQVQDHRIHPNRSEQYDMLSFFANVRQQVKDFLKNRLLENGIKWFLSVQVELQKELPDQQTTNPHFRSRTYSTFNNLTFDDDELNESFQKMFESFEKYIRESSGWVLKKVLHLIVHTVVYSPLSGSSYVELPKKLRFSRSLLNIRNKDQKCFIWSILASLHPKDSSLVLDYEMYENELNLQEISYPVSVDQIKKFEKHNPSLSINVFGYENEDLEPCSFAYKVVSINPKIRKNTVVYRGPDASKKLLECLLRESYEITQTLQSIQPLNLSAEEEYSFQRAKKCYLCEKYFTNTDIKARHHFHFDGSYIGAAHLSCNLQCKQATFIPVIFHNLKNFDSHLLCQSIGQFKNYKIKCIPQTMEKYISFSIGKLRFLDSFAFLPSSLDTLVNNLAQDGLKGFTHFQSEIRDNSDLLLRKGVYCYEYMSDWKKFDDTQLSPKDKFYSSLTKESNSDDEYRHAQAVFYECRCKTLGDYHDLYLKTDVLLLADVFEAFRRMSLSCYGLDPCHFYTSPGLSWQAMLKMTGVTLQLMTDIDQILFIERGIRGGISQISNSYKKVNNPYLDDYDPNEENSFLAYYDVNNLYGFSMSEKLPTGFFRFLTSGEVNAFDINQITENSSKGYILEVDLEYPEYLHDNHNDYPLAPERKFIPNEQLSPYAQKVLKKLYNCTDKLPPRAKVEKLLTTLENKYNYVLHYRNLQLYLHLGLKLKKIHKILEFEQEAFMKPYIDFNTRRRQQTSSAFEKSLMKLFNNSCFGKTMENLRKHRSVELCNTPERLKKLSSKASYKIHRIFSEDLVGVELSRIKVKLNKPIYTGMTVLDLSKHTMYDFYYNHLKSLHEDKVQLQMTDTDSFLVSVKTDDIFQDMHTYSYLFDTSDFPHDHFLHSNVNKKVMGKMKSETNDKCISEYCGLRSKNYAFKCGMDEEKRLKGISKVVVEKELTLNHYKKTLFEESRMTSEMNLIRSHDHEIYCEKIKKVGLSCFDDKRYLLSDGVSSLAYGHYKIQQK